ncbi:MAG: acyl-CoA dehydrogenase family protein [Acidimicrobiales bacterium]
MHFAFSAQQIEFRDAIRQVLARTCPPTALRRAFEQPEARPGRWATLAGLGMIGLTVPESSGGLGLGMVDLVLVLEETGRVALPEPFLETTALAVPALVETAGAGLDGGVATHWLSAIARGTTAAAVGRLEGMAEPIAGADGADLFVLATTAGGQPEVHILAKDDVRILPVGSLDPTRRLAVCDWTPRGHSLIASGPAADRLIRRTSQRAAVSTAAQLLGLADRMVSLGADYARERHQFGRPIGSFQAVKHLLAGAQVALEIARPVVYAAAWDLDEGLPTARRSASMAKAMASEAAGEAARVALQVHGAIGYTWECDLHFFLKRTWALAEAWGSAAQHRAILLDSLLADRGSLLADRDSPLADRDE